MQTETSRAKDIYDRVCSKGVAAIDEFIMTQKSEELFLDFKRSSDNGAGDRLSQGDRNNLAKAISGFGNSSGGVIIWGVDCSKNQDGADVANNKVPIQNPNRFCSWLNDAVSGCTLPPHSGIINTPILDDAGGHGFVATLIPQSNQAPHQTVKTLKYYIRAGSSFVPTPHQILAGLFGKRPNPFVYSIYSVTSLGVEKSSFKFRVEILIRNDGPGVARDLYLTALKLSEPGPNCSIHFQSIDPLEWKKIMTWGRHISLISKPEIRLPPKAQIHPFTLHGSFMPPFNEPLEIEGTVGAESAVPFSFNFKATKEEVSQAYAECINNEKRNASNDEKLVSLSRLMGLKKPENI